MEIKIKMKIGQTELEVTDSVDNVKQMFKQVAFYNSLPSVGPNGEDDVSFQHRTTKDGHEYYSLVSKKANKEFKLGQTKDNKSLYPKGWEDAYSYGQEESSGEDAVSSSALKAATSRIESAKPALAAAPKAEEASDSSKAAVNSVLSKYGIKR